MAGSVGGIGGRYLEARGRVGGSFFLAQRSASSEWAEKSAYAKADVSCYRPYIAFQA